VIGLVGQRPRPSRCCSPRASGRGFALTQGGCGRAASRRRDQLIVAPATTPRRRRGSIGSGMKRALVIALVLTVLLTGVPVLMVMSAATCADCDHALMAASACLLAVLAALVAVGIALFGVPLRMRPALRASLLTASGLDRPPRLA
jgi:hypothetical protein